MSLSNLGLDAFLMVYRRKTVLAASKDLGITQTAVTQRVRALERELGAILFVRSRKGMTLTLTGEKLLSYCKQKEIMEKQAIANIRNEGHKIPVRVTITGSTYFIYSRVLPVLAEAKKKSEAAFYSLQINDEIIKIQLLKRGQTDLVFLPREEVPLEFDSKILKKADYVLVGGSRFRNQTRKYPVIDFSKDDHFTTEFFKRFKIDYDPNSYRHTINNTLMMPSLIEQNLGVAVLDLDHFKEAKKNYKIYDLCPGKKYSIEWAVAWLARPELPDYLKNIIDLIK